MTVFTVVLIIFTAAMGILTSTLVGVLVLTNLFRFDYEKAGRYSFVFSFFAIIAILALSGSSYAVACTWMSGISMLIMLGFLITLLSRSINWR